MAVKQITNEIMLFLQMDTIRLKCNNFFQLQDIDFGGFKIFMDIFLEVDTPDELCRHLFLSFVRMPQCTNTEGKTLQVKTKN